MNFKIYILLVASCLLICTVGYGKVSYSHSHSDEFSLPEFVLKEYINGNDNDNKYFFIAPYKTQPDYYLEIIDRMGTPVFIKQLTNLAYDFKIQENGYLSYYCSNNKMFYMLDSAFQIADSFIVTNDYNTNFHDIKILKNKHVILIGNKVSIVDMSGIVSGGSENATVIDGIIQEFDENKNLIFEWNSRDHYNFTDSYRILDSQYIDYAHINSVDIDSDNNLILSACYLSEITKIDRTTGDIIWRLGGKNNEFTFTNDTIGFSYQHSAISLDNGNICLFDNGRMHELEYSRGLMYNLDQENKIATLLNEYKHEENVYSDIMGNIQHTPNGKIIVGWGTNLVGWATNNNNHILTEFDSSGTPVFDIVSSNKFQSYRAFSFPWKTNKFYSNIDSLNFDTVGYNNDSIIQIRIQNNSSEIIELSSFTNFNPVYRIIDDFPINISGNGFVDLSIQFKPDRLGDNYKDILTINSDSYNEDLLERIAIQINLFGYSPDIFPPEFSSYPSDGSSGIPLETIINLKFNESIRFINNNEITNGNIQDFLKLRKGSIDGEVVNITTSINEDKNEITITPEFLLNYSKNYFVVIDGQIEDFNDNDLSDVFISFRTSDANIVITQSIAEAILYPNPVSKLIKLHLQKKADYIVIYNMNGELIYKNSNINYPLHIINFEGYKTGTYILEIYYDGIPEAYNFIKM